MKEQAMNKLEQAMTEQLDEMIGRPEPCSICQSGEVTYLDYGTGEEWHKPAHYCPNCGRYLWGGNLNAWV